jgi:HAD superfamily hydrolase (TIGR01549 family)
LTLISVAVNAILFLPFSVEKSMTLTLLLDLDGTLLDNELDGFLEAYFGGFGKHVRSIVDPGIFIQELLAATQKMVANRLPDRTLEEVFDAAFYPAVKLNKEESRDVLDSFYDEVFPTFRTLTKARPDAVKLVEEAFARGYRVGIATNPLFPRAAILQRLDWAGLPVQNYPFILVPSFETFHFSKPSPAFFAEFLAGIGQPDEPVVMVGDNPINDIFAANQAGIATFWLDQGQPPAGDKQLATAHGSLEDLIPWLDSVPIESLTPNYSSPKAVLANLAGVAAAFDTIGRQLPNSVWIKKLEPDEWCLAEIMCHMRDVEHEVNLPRLNQVISETNPFIPGKDTDPWVLERQYILQDCLEALGSFLSSRIELLSILESLETEDWQRPARHAILGPTNIQELAGIIASHDRLHIRQAHQVIHSLSQETY